MAGEADVRRSGADAGEQVLDLAVAQRRDGEAELLQGVGQHGLRAGIGGRDRGAADQRLGERQGVVRLVMVGPLPDPLPQGEGDVLLDLPPLRGGLGRGPTVNRAAIR